LTWFALGLVASSPVWAVIGLSQRQPRDYTQSLPQPLREIAPEWMTDAQVVTTGSIVMIASADATNASALIYPLRHGSFPAVFLYDDSGDGRIDSIGVTDSGYHTIALEVVDGTLASSTYSTGPGMDAVSFQDANLDGHNDYRFGPGREFAVWAAGAWRPVIQEEDLRFIDVDGRRLRLSLVDGLWRIAETDEQP
jgi:hypothetical protein